MYAAAQTASGAAGEPASAHTCPAGSVRLSATVNIAAWIAWSSKNGTIGGPGTRLP